MDRVGLVSRVGLVGRVDRRVCEVQEVRDSEIALGVTSDLNKEVEYMYSVSSSSQCSGKN